MSVHIVWTTHEIYDFYESRNLNTVVVYNWGEVGLSIQVWLLLNSLNKVIFVFDY